MCVVSFAFPNSLLQLGMIGVFLFDPAAIRPSNRYSTVLAQRSPNARPGVGLCSPTLDDARPLLAQCLTSVLPEIDPSWGSAQKVVRVRLGCAGMARWRRKGQTFRQTGRSGRFERDLFRICLETCFLGEDIPLCSGFGLLVHMFVVFALIEH